MKHFSEDGLLNALTELTQRHEQSSEEIIEDICSQIQDFQKQFGPSAKVVLGLSGGLDSTLTTYLVCRALGPDKVIPVCMPAYEEDDAEEYFAMVIERLGILDSKVLHIGRYVEQLADGVKRITSNELDRITIGNIASRIRINILYAMARELNGFVVGTSNRTEFVQGYATKYGTPMSCDFGILDELYKTDIRTLSQVLGVPDEILNRTPTTGFFPGQSHEDELAASMDEQDAGTYLLFEKNLPVATLVENYGASEKYLHTLLSRYKQCKHKRILQSEHVRLGYIHDE